MRRNAVKLLAVVGSAAVIVGAVNGAASAATPSTVTGFAEIAFIAPTSGQSVKLMYKDDGGGWGDYCFRWAGGKNTGAIASDATGIEFYNWYLERWGDSLGLSTLKRAWELKASLYASGDCSGSALKSKNLPTRSQSTTQYVVDFR